MNSKDLSLLQPYCENDMKLLKKVSRSIFMKFNESLTNADYDDFYSIANMTLWQAYNSYNPDLGVNFEGFLHTCLQKKFKSELTKRHRQKRLLNQFAVSLDSINENDEECSLLDYIPSDFDTFDEALKRQEKEQRHNRRQKTQNTSHTVKYSVKHQRLQNGVYISRLHCKRHRICQFSDKKF